MKFLSYLLIPMAVGFVFAGIQKEVRKAEKGMDENNFVVRQSAIASLVGGMVVFFAGSCLLLMTIFPNDSADLWVYLLFFVFGLLGAALSLYCLNWKITVDGNNISFKSLLRPEKTFAFADIKRVKIKEATNYQQITLYSETKKLLSVESNCKGYNVFVARLKKENENAQNQDTPGDA